MMYSPIHKVRLSVGYLAYPREKKERAQSRRVTLHTIQAHMLPVPTEKRHNHELPTRSQRTAGAGRVAVGRGTARPDAG